MNKMIMILMSLMLSQITACSFIGVYAVPSIEGRVVDAETKEPIEGAVVMVQRSMRGGFEGFTGYYKYQETLTDNYGNYHVPALGLVFVPNRFDDYDPQLIIYKAGYIQGQLSNSRRCHDVKSDFCYNYGRPPDDWYRESVWDGKTVGLMRFTGTNKQFADLIHGSATNITNTSTRRSKCSWIGFEVPNYLGTINRDLKALGYKGLGYTPESVKTEMAYQDRDCPKQWKKFFEEYTP